MGHEVATLVGYGDVHELPDFRSFLFRRHNHAPRVFQFHCRHSSSSKMISATACAWWIPTIPVDWGSWQVGRGDGSLPGREFMQLSALAAGIRDDLDPAREARRLDFQRITRYGRGIEARYPSGKGEVCKTFMRRFDSGPRLQSGQ